MRIRRLLSWAGWMMVLALLSCDNTNQVSDPLPYAYVNETIYMNEVRAIPLATRNNSFIYINGGLKGIIVYRQAPGNFTALERQSPVTPTSCQVKVDPAQVYLVDTCSNTQWDFTGGLLSGRASANLRQYTVNFDGTRILITN